MHALCRFVWAEAFELTVVPVHVDLQPFGGRPPMDDRLHHDDVPW